MPRTLSTRELISLQNWRERPHSCFSFHNVREFVGTQQINKSENARHLPVDLISKPELQRAAELANLDDFLIKTETDAFVIFKNGCLAFDWRADHYSSEKPHIVFSISKSITGMLAGQLQHVGLLNPDRLVRDYLPDMLPEGYGGCTVQHLLDMQAAIDFDENYLDTTGAYVRYRIATMWNPPSDAAPKDEDLRTFLLSLRCSASSHGEVFRYLSPNSDLLGIVLEQAGSGRYADLLSEYVLGPLGCAHEAYITVDRAGTARAAGGICLHPHDLARVGQGILDAIISGENASIPAAWIQDTLTSGNVSAWENGEFSGLLPQGNYRNQWYVSDRETPCLLAIGIHGQWLYIDLKRQIVIVKLSSQAEPVNEALDAKLIRFFGRIAKSIG